MNNNERQNDNPDQLKSSDFTVKESLSISEVAVQFSYRGEKYEIVAVTKSDKDAFESMGHKSLAFKLVAGRNQTEVLFEIHHPNAIKNLNKDSEKLKETERLRTVIQGNFDAVFTAVNDKQISVLARLLN